MFSKPIAIPDQGHVDYVHRCPCLLCSGAFYLPTVEDTVKLLTTGQQRKTITDSHHLLSVLNYRRRTFDLTIIPLCRTHHGWMDTAQGKQWERGNLPRLLRIALGLAYRNDRISWECLTITLELPDERIKEAVGIAYIESSENYRRKGAQAQEAPPTRDGTDRGSKKKVASKKGPGRKMQGGKLPKGRKFPKGRKL